MPDEPLARPTFTPYRAVVAEGARIGIMTCLICGAAVVIDPNDDDDMAERHYRWHTDR